MYDVSGHRATQSPSSHAWPLCRFSTAAPIPRMQEVLRALPHATQRLQEALQEAQRTRLGVAVPLRPYATTLSRGCASAAANAVIPTTSHSLLALRAPAALWHLRGQRRRYAMTSCVAAAHAVPRASTPTTLLCWAQASWARCSPATHPQAALAPQQLLQQPPRRQRRQRRSSKAWQAQRRQQRQLGWRGHL